MAAVLSAVFLLGGLSNADFAGRLTDPGDLAFFGPAGAGDRLFREGLL